MRVISAMVEKVLGTATWRRKGLLSAIVAQDSPGLSSARAGSGAPAGSGALDNNPFLLHFAVQSVLNIDVEVEEPEAS